MTGKPAQIERVTQEFGVAVARVDLGGGDYTVDHSAAVFLLDDQARRVAVFTPPFEIQPVAADLRSVADRLTAKHESPESSTLTPARPATHLEAAAVRRHCSTCCPSTCSPAWCTR